MISKRFGGACEISAIEGKGHVLAPRDSYMVNYTGTSPKAPAPAGVLSADVSLPASSLRVIDVVKRFGTLTALDGVSLELKSGECVGLLGPNGAGKSTLIRAIAGRVLLEAGSILVAGHPAGSSQARDELGWIPQDVAIYPRLTCRENLRAFGQYQGLKGVRLDESIAWCLEWAVLNDRSNDLAGKLSGGMKRRLNMAAGMLHRPRVVLMDEPTIGVDPQSRNRIFEMIELLRDQGHSIVYTTHYMEEAERLCDRVAIVDHGRIIAEGPHQQLIEQTFSARSYLCMRFAAASERLIAWSSLHHGRMRDSTVELTVTHPEEIGALLQSLAQNGLGLEDLSLRRPTLESVFLHLTGRELRE